MKTIDTCEEFLSRLGKKWDPTFSFSLSIKLAILKIDFNQATVGYLEDFQASDPQVELQGETASA
jgi:hypothetical protein